MTRKITMMLAAVLCVASCQDQQGQYEPQRAQGSVRFRVGTEGTESKAAYRGDAASGIQPIDWEKGDVLGIYCAAAKEEKYAAYSVSEVSTSGTVSTGVIEPVDKDIVWGTGDHVFYSCYPEKTKGGIVTGLENSEVSASLTDEQNVTGTIAKSGTVWKAAPDMKNMLMVSRSKVYPADAGIPAGEVFLSFTAMTTALQFTVKNDTGAELELVEVSLISGNKKASAPAINGAFTVNLSNWATPEAIPLGNTTITYTKEYPTVPAATSTTDMSQRTVKIAVGTSASPLKLAVNDSFTFTFFVAPTANFDDLTFKFTKKDGSWMSTRLGYTDGTGLLFPRYMKSRVDGILLPKGAQWTVKYGPDVVSWNGESQAIDPMAELSTDPVVTSWDTGVETDIELDKQPVDLFSVGDSKKVRFTQGNLYWDGNAGEYKIEANQYDYRCFNGHTNDEAFLNGIKTTTPENTVGLFYGVKNTETSNKPYASTYGTPAPADAGTDILFTNETVDTPNQNFTVDGVTGKYRTLSSTEWTYLFNKRTVNGGKGFGKSYSLNVTYCGQKGTVIYPDYYSGTPLSSSTDYSELPEGSVFLPLNGFRYFGAVTMNYCVYWGSDAGNASEFHILLCDTSNVSPDTSRGRSLGFGIRLVSDVE